MRPSGPGKIGPFSLRKANSAVSLELGQSFSGSEKPYCGAAVEGALVDGNCDSHFPDSHFPDKGPEYRWVRSALSSVLKVDVLVSCLCAGLFLDLSVCLNASTYCFD